jgi:hypothetical protein
LDKEQLQGDDLKAILNDGWPDSILEEAVQALETGSTALISSSDPDVREVKIERLEAEVLDLKQRLKILQAVEKTRSAKRADQMARREDVGAKRRAAYFEAKRQGKDGDTAMKVWEDEEAKIDAESDDDAQTSTQT